MSDEFRVHAERLQLDPAAIRDLLRRINAAPPLDAAAWRALVPRSDDAAWWQAVLAERERLAARTADDDLPLDRRLAALRARMGDLGFDALLLPRIDDLRNEYLPAQAERVAWLTGFTGSAGFVIVMAERAALFVDGRYTAQAAQQVDAALYEIVEVPESSPPAWLAAQAPRDLIVGYDPALHTRPELARYAKAAKRHALKLTPVTPHPVDVLWTTRPPAPLAPITAHDLAFAGEASADKRARIGRAVDEAGADAAVLSAVDSVMWLLNVRGRDVPMNPLGLSTAIVHQNGTLDWFVDAGKLAGLPSEDGVLRHDPTRFLPALDALAGKRVLVDPNQTNLAVIECLEAAGATLVEGEDPCVLAKACKNAVELDGARAAQRRDGAALCRVLAWLAEQDDVGALDELTIDAKLAEERARDPLYRGLSFEAIVGSGPHGAIVHYRVTPASNRKLDVNSLLLIDSGAQYQDGTTDITRTVALGTPSAAMRRAFTLVLKGHIAVARALYPKGTTGGQLDTLARHALWQHGHDFAHGTGHGVGSYLCVHEGPARIGKNAGTKLHPGMLLSNEPGYYRNGAFGIRIENLLIVTDAGRPDGAEHDMRGFETISRAPIDRALVEPGLLTAEERAWLDGYHATVRRDLLPLLDGSAARWLERATAPLDNA